MTDDRLLGRQSRIVRLRCTPDVAEQLANALARRPDTSHADLISGGTEVLCAMNPRSRQARNELLFDRLQRTPQVISVSVHCLLHTFSGGPLGWLDKTQALEPDQEAALRLPYSEPVAAPIALEEADEALLAVLRRDGRAAFSELQTITGPSESAVKRRQERLRSTGILYFKVQHDRESLGHGIRAMLWLSVAGPSAVARSERPGQQCRHHAAGEPPRPGRTPGRRGSRRDQSARPDPDDVRLPAAAGGQGRRGRHERHLGAGVRPVPEHPDLQRDQNRAALLLREPAHPTRRC